MDDNNLTAAQKRKLPDAVKKAAKFRDHLFKLIGVASAGNGFLVGEPTRGDLLDVINALHTGLVHALIGAELPKYKPIEKPALKTKGRRKRTLATPPPSTPGAGK